MFEQDCFNFDNNFNLIFLFKYKQIRKYIMDDHKYIYIKLCLYFTNLYFLNIFKNICINT